MSGTHCEAEIDTEFEPLTVTTVRFDSHHCDKALLRGLVAAYFGVDTKVNSTGSQYAYEVVWCDRTFPAYKYGPHAGNNGFWLKSAIVESEDGTVVHLLPGGSIHDHGRIVQLHIPEPEKADYWSLALICTLAGIIGGFILGCFY